MRVVNSPRSPLALGRLVAPAVPAVVMGSAAGVAASLLTAALVMIIGLSLREPFTLPLGWLAAVAVALAVVTALGPLARARAASAVRTRAQHLAYRRLLEVGPALRDDRRTGDVAGIVTDGVERVGAMAGRFLPLVVRGAVVPILVAVAAMVIDVWAGIALLVVFPAVPAALRSLERSFRAAGERLRSSRDSLAADFLDALQGLTTLVLFDRALDWTRVLAERSEEVRRQTMAVLSVNQRALIWVDLVYSIVSVLLVVVVVWWRLSVGAIGLPEAVTLFLLAVVAIEPLVDVVSFFYLGALGLAAARRIRELAEIPPRPTGDLAPAGDARGEVAFDNVTFTYEGSTTPAVREVSLEVERRSSVALIGRSGAGKSTLAALVLGLRGPQQGRVLVDGVEVGRAHPAWLSRRITYVGQSTHLFTASVAANLRVADPSASPDELAEACRLANVLDVVLDLPEGFDTVVGERGRGLSGGQAQRLGIARAILADTPLVILDEATSALDLETEARVAEAMERLMAGRTVLVVAHRITTARRCDRVVHLEAGRIVDAGAPGELEEGLFHRMGGDRP